MNVIKKQLQIVSLENKIQVFLPEQFTDKVKFLCSKISQVEWSGILFYEVEGTITKPEEMRLICRDILLMDKGTKTYTEYEFDETVVEYQMENPELLTCKMGHIHSHNSMATFFSGTDMEELQDNSPNHNFYFSLIVNNFMETCAKVSFVGKTSITNIKYQCKDENGSVYNIVGEDIQKNLMFTYDCIVSTEANIQQVPKSFQDRYNYIEEITKKKQEQKVQVGFNNSHVSHKSYDNFQRYNKHDKHTNPSLWEQEAETFIQDSPSIEELFTCYVLRLGNMKDGDTLESAINHVNSEVKDMQGYLSKMLSNYVHYYTTFFSNLNISTDNHDEFADMLEETIILLSEYSSSFIKIKQIEKMLEKFLAECEKIELKSI
jgi:hypothetical protein